MSHFSMFEISIFCDTLAQHMKEMKINEKERFLTLSMWMKKLWEYRDVLIKWIIYFESEFSIREVYRLLYATIGLLDSDSMEISKYMEINEYMDINEQWNRLIAGVFSVH